MNFQGVRGMKDLFGAELSEWAFAETSIRSCFADFGFREIRTPALEDARIFKDAVGEETDIVEKQMYVLQAGEESLALRPEGTAGFLRAAIEHNLHRSGQPQRFYYYAPMFRHERPQKGRLRQFFQFGAEIIQDPSAEADCELIVLLHEIYERLGVKNYQIEINSLGSKASRAQHRKALQDFFRPKLQSLCPQCQGRFERAPLRILDCKNEDCQKLSKGAPEILSFLDVDDKAHFERVQARLKSSPISFVVNPRIVRGLDYYTRTAFEFISTDLGAQSALAAGGRYDGLSERFGATAFPGTGWALGMERLMLALEGGPKKGIEAHPFVYLAPLGEKAFEILFPLSLELKKKGIRAELFYGEGKKMAFFLKDADRSGADYALLVGDDELTKNEVVLKNLKERSQSNLPLKGISEELLRRAK